MRWEILKKKVRSYVRIIRARIPPTFLIFVGIGLCTFTFDYLLYLWLLREGVPMNAAKAISSLIAVLCNYILNARFNFGGGHVLGARSLALYLGLYTILIGIHVVLNRILYLTLHDAHAAVFCAMTVSVFLNYASIKKFFTVIKT